MHEISTAGFAIGYAVEANAGSIPTTFTKIPNVKSISEVNPEPSTYDVTDLSDEVWKRYILGLKDPGGNVTLGVNVTEQFKTAWASCVSAAEAAAEGSTPKAMWFEVLPKGWTEGFFFAGMPADLGLPAVETDAVFEGSVYIVPNQINGWETKKTIS